MSCERAQGVDLAGFLVDSEAPEWADFREHYPECPDCSRALAGWVQLENALRRDSDPDAAHIPVDELVRLVERPASLPKARRRKIEEHLGACSACSDQRAALSEFDFSTLEGLTPPGAIPRMRAAVRRLRGRAADAFSGSSEGAKGWVGDAVVPEPEPEVVLLSREGPAPASAEAVPGSGPASASLAVLEVLEGEDGQGERYALRPGTNRIGRSREAEVHIPDSSLSRVEARIEAEGEQFRLVALHERNPVRVDGERVRSAHLRDGAVIELGGHRLRFRVGTPT